MSRDQFRPRRSCLYMPGSNARALEKTKSIDADVLIFDLEDAVGPDEKEAARTRVCAAVQSGQYGAREIIVRVNGLETEWGLEDLAAVCQANPDGILAPKIGSADDIARMDEAISKAGGKPEMPLWVMIETPKAILNIQDIADMGRSTRLAVFVMGTNDLAKEMRAQITPDRHAFQVALSLTLTAARAYNLLAIDGVYNDIKNESGFRDECEQGRVLGFDGKTLIHPSQVIQCNELFTPDDAQVSHARAIIAAFDAPENAGKGVIKVDGQMTELLHLTEAERLVAIADAIAGRQ